MLSERRTAILINTYLSSDAAGWLFCGSGRVGLRKVRVGSGRAEILRVRLRLRAEKKF